ncbi:MAG: phosphohydrolase [Alphaproteobacteria bacterium]|nr:phosphohydrolase [Alphaproteobacteria bacterium]
MPDDSRSADRPTPLQRELEPWSDAREDLHRPLADPAWAWVAGTSMETTTAAEWGILERQGDLWFRDRPSREMLAMLEAQKDETAYGHGMNNYGHSLQTATRAWRDGADEEDVVVALLHDLGQNIAPNNHGEFGAVVLRPFVSPVNHWLVKHHTVFQRYHRLEHPTSERDTREQYRGHPAFEATVRFCERWDQPAFDPDYPTLPLAAFEPIVHRFFARPPSFTDPM